MKFKTLFTTPLLALLLMVGAFPAHAERQKSFEFYGEVNSYDRRAGLLVVEDLVFRISEKTRVHKHKRHKAVLGDIRRGEKVGFNPRRGGGDASAPHIDEIWILPARWKGSRGYAEARDN